MWLAPSALMAAAALATPTSPIHTGDRPLVLRWSAGLANPYLMDSKDEGSLFSLGLLYRTGIGVAAALEWGFSRFVGAQVQLELDTFRFDRENTAGYSTRSATGHVTGGPATALGGSLSVAARLPRRRRISPFVLAGGGLSRIAYVAHTVETGSFGQVARERDIPFRDTAPAIVGGAGIDLRVREGAGLTVDWTYHHAFTERREILGAFNTIATARYWTLRFGGTMQVH